MTERPRVLIVGGGFAGLAAARALRHAPVDIALIDRRNHQGTTTANLIGDGLYGVDLKEVDGKPLVIEVNDNPNIDAGIEDAVLGSELYRTIMEGFLRRIEKKRGLEKRP